MTLAASQRSELPIYFQAFEKGDYSQQLHFYLDVEDTLIERQVDFVGVAQ
jgi:hypothetical protein